MTESVLASPSNTFFSNFGFTQDIFTILNPPLTSPSKSEPTQPQEHLSSTSTYSTSDDDIPSEIGTTHKQLNKGVIKAYTSKLKRKFLNVYENNSKDYLETTKYKMYHKCCYPHCGRTFSSAGWLRAHFNEHLKELEHSQFNQLFDMFINNKYNSIFKKPF